MYIVPCLYTSAGVPSTVTADRKLTQSENATGKGFIVLNK